MLRIVRTFNFLIALSGLAAMTFSATSASAARQFSDREVVPLSQYRPRPIDPTRLDQIRARQTLTAPLIVEVMESNVAQMILGTAPSSDLPRRTTTTPDLDLASVIFSVLDSTTLGSVRARSYTELAIGKKLFAENYLVPVLLEDFPQSMILFNRLLPFLSYNPRTTDGNLAISQFIEQMATERKLPDQGFQPRSARPPTPSQITVWLQLMAYGLYYLDPGTLLDLHWYIGRDFFPELDVKGYSDMLRAVAQLYVQIPEHKINLKDRSYAAGKTLITLLRGYSNSSNLNTLGIIMSHSQNNDVRLAAREAIKQDYLILVDHKDEATALLDTTSTWRPPFGFATLSLVNACMSLLSRSTTGQR